MSESNIDTLAYAYIQNNLTSEQLTSSGLSTKLIISNPSETNQILSEMLDNTTIKRACCINKGRPMITSEQFPVTVRIPTPANYNYGTNPLSEVWKKFGYIDSTIYIPSSMCDALDAETGNQYNYNSQTCQDFMGLYCANVGAFYNSELKALNSPYDDNEFAQYKPECACFAEMPSYITGAIAAGCWAVGCDPNSNTAFVDTQSRTPCDVTICNTNLNLAGMSVGGAANINSKVSQQCGNQINQAVQGKTGSSNTTANTGSNTTANTNSNASSNTNSNTPSNASSNTNSNASSNTNSNTGSNTNSNTPSNATANTNSNTTANTGSNAETEATNSETTNILSWFGASKSYIGVIIVLILVCLLFCCSSFFMLKKKNKQSANDYDNDNSFYNGNDNYNDYGQQ